MATLGAVGSSADIFTTVLHKDGQTEYVWHATSSRLKIDGCGDDSKGLGVFNGSKSNSLPRSTIIFSNEAAVAKCIQYRSKTSIAHYCFNCLQQIPPSTLSFSHPQCRYFICCSRNCLNIVEPMVIAIAPAVNAIVNSLDFQKSEISQSNLEHNVNLTVETRDEDSDKQSSILLLQWLYFLVFWPESNSSQQIAARQCLNLCSDLESIRLRYSSLAEYLMELFHNVLPKQYIDNLLSFCASPSLPISQPTSLIAHMLKIIHLNAQPMYPYSTASDATFLFLLPTIPRLNHSCNPNAALILEKVNTAMAGNNLKLQVSVIALRDIMGAEELTISYLQDLCLPVSDRRSFLSQAFGFICHCSRCMSESNHFLHQSIMNKSGSKLLLKLKILQDQLNRYFESEKSYVSSSRSLVYIEQRELLLTAQFVFDTVCDRKKSSGSDTEFSLEKLGNPCTTEDFLLCMAIPSLLRDAAGVILQQYTERFQYLQQEQQQVSRLFQIPGNSLSAQEAITLVLESKSKLIHYGWWFLRSGQYVALAYELTHIPTGKAQLKRLELMVMTSMYGAVTARAYVETFKHIEQLSHGLSLDTSEDREKYVQNLFSKALPSPRELLEALRGGISMAIDVQLVIKTVYVTSHNAAHRDYLGHVALTQETNTTKTKSGGSNTSIDVWTYIDDLFGRACKAKKYCQTVFEQVAILHDRFSA